jgi:hypothetical protein
MNIKNLQKICKLFVILVLISNSNFLKGNLLSLSFNGASGNIFFANDTLLILKAQAIGMGGWLGVDASIKSFNFDRVREIHIIPIGDEAQDRSAVVSTMLVAENGYFEFQDEILNGFTGRLKIFYNADRSKLVTSVKLKDGKFDGRIKVFTSDGKIFCDRDYSEGKCISSRIDVYDINWRFDFNASNLEISTKSQHFIKNADGKSEITLGPTIYAEDGNSLLNKMIEKEVFKNTFKVNSMPYSGVIHGFQGLDYAVPMPLFTLNFLNGKLHGNIIIYTMMGYERLLEERFEHGKLVETIYVIDSTLMDGMAKPVLYFYPETEKYITVSLNLKGKITHSYPSYSEDGWEICALPNGTLYDNKGTEYYALFWEGINSKPFSYDEGNIIAGKQTADYLEKTLEVLGLNRREANEFIMYWLPQMENNPFNLIHFSTDEYKEEVQLNVNPKPETTIRIMMVWSPLNTPIIIPEQNIEALSQKRKGFTVVEWGGLKQFLNRDVLSFR